VESQGEGQGTTFRFSLPCDPGSRKGTDTGLADPTPR